MRYASELWFRLLLAFVTLAVGLTAVRWLLRSDADVKSPVARALPTRSVEVKSPVASAFPTRAAEGVPLFDGLNVRNPVLRVSEARQQSFTVELRRAGGGVLEHRIVLDGIRFQAAGRYASRVAGASAAFTPTPTLSATQGFAAGIGLLKVDGTYLVFDTRARDGRDLAGMAIIEGGTSAAARDGFVAVGVLYFDIAGVVRERLALRFRNHEDVLVGWDSVLPREGHSVRVRVFGFVR